MGAAEQKAKNSRMASDLVARGIWHGKRQSKPYPNSGGTTATSGPGSSRYQRMMSNLRGGRR